MSGSAEPLLLTGSPFAWSADLRFRTILKRER
ncbi:hypothetical protein Halar_1629 [halophilic archaeon DL31]|jgi:hypothetical protein|nr:hypothetical protein Halar_1629 [halophilic archaeon DL31]